LRGQRDVVASKGAYLHTLAILGVVADSAYESLKNNDPKGWMAVQPKYSNDVQRTIANIRTFDSKCKNEMVDNMRENTNRVVRERPDWSNADLANRLYNMVHAMRPEVLSQAVVYTDHFETHNHFHAC